MTLKISDSQINGIMEQFAKKNNLIFEFPFSYVYYLLDDRINKTSFRKTLIVMQSLENIRNQAILGHEYKQGIVQKVVNCQHPLQQVLTLQDISQMFPDWTKDNFEPLSFNIKEILR